MSTSWPEIPQLEPGDFCVEVYLSDDRSRCCMVEWMRLIFNEDGKHPAREALATEALFLEISDTLGVHGLELLRSQLGIRLRFVMEGSAVHLLRAKQDIILAFNDGNARDVVARVWRNAMIRLGYTGDIATVGDAVFPLINTDDFARDFFGRRVLRLIRQKGHTKYTRIMRRDDPQNHIKGDRGYCFTPAERQAS